MGVCALAALLGVAPKPLDASRGVEKPPAVAVIDEDACIGCARCLLVCPVDAILGAAKHMHTVLLEECTGCERCLPVCPVDCIRMEPIAGNRAQSDRNNFRRRYEARQSRLEREKRERQAAAEHMKAALARSAPG